MGKKIFSAVLFLICVCFTGCSGGTSYPADDSYHFETDCQYSVGSQGKGGVIAESAEGYYFALTIHGQHSLFFVDKATMETIPLCGKPNCLHYEGTDEGKRELCNAHFVGAQYEGTVYFNNGRLYVPEGGAGNDCAII